MPTRSKSKRSKKNLGGKPTLYKPEYPKQLVDFMAEGYDFKSFCSVARVGITTLHAWCKVHPEFKTAKALGRDLSYKWWIDKAKKNLMYSRSTVFNSTVWIFCMKNMFYWRDVPDTLEEDCDGVEFVDE